MLTLLVTGRVGQDAEVKKLDGDRAVVNFSLAHSERWKDKAGVKQERTKWIDCAYWRTHAGADLIAQHIKKGCVISAVGDPEVRAYLSPDQKPIGAQSLTVHSLTFEAKAAGTSTAAPAATPPPAPTYTNTSDDDDLPF